VSKIPSARAGYMELKGAKKDAQCSKVEVAGGVSQCLGCCDHFRPENDKVDAFKCGSCEYVQISKSATAPRRHGIGSALARQAGPIPKGRDGSDSPELPKQRSVSAGDPISRAIPDQENGMSGDMDELEEIELQRPGISGTVGSRRKSFGRRIGALV